MCSQLKSRMNCMRWAWKKRKGKTKGRSRAWIACVQPEKKKKEKEKKPSGAWSVLFSLPLLECVLINRMRSECVLALWECVPGGWRAWRCLLTPYTAAYHDRMCFFIFSYRMMFSHRMCSVPGSIYGWRHWWCMPTPYTVVGRALLPHVCRWRLQVLSTHSEKFNALVYLRCNAL